MPETLGDYLNEVANTLGALPPARRDEELREMRQHLLNAVAVNQEAGQSEGEAVANAIEQFGAAQTIGENVVAVWRRERLLNRRSLWWTAICTIIVLRISGWMLHPLMLSVIRDAALSPQDSFWGEAGMMFVGSNFVRGLLVGWVFSKNAVSGAGLGMATSFAFFLCLEIVQAMYTKHDPFHLLHVNSVAWVTFNCIVTSSFILTGAWIGSWWRKEKRKPRQHTNAVRRG